jgi:transposase-like protein
MENLKLKESIITEYLTRKVGLRKLGKKYGMSFHTIHNWVMQYQGRMKKRTTHPIVKVSKDLAAKQPLPTEVKELQAELHKARLLNEVLTEVINIAEQELGIPIRKKPGTKQF